RRFWTRLRVTRPELDSLGAEFTVTARKRAFSAPHFAVQVLQRRSIVHAVQPELRSTLDCNLQLLLERRIAEFVSARESVGVHNAAGVLVDGQNMEVVGEVGSADFFDQEIDGQVDGTRCRRSPGSALKPFVYALAMDQGLVHPCTLLADAPRRFGDYDPENF